MVISDGDLMLRRDLFQHLMCDSIANSESLSLRGLRGVNDMDIERFLTGYCE